MIRATGRSCLIFTGLTALFIAAGCGGSSKGTVSGTVTYNGQPLPTGTIVFIAQQGSHDTVHADIKDGKYTIPSIDIGTAKVSVETRQTGAMGPSLSGAPAAPVADAGKFVPIPAKYANAESSGLTYDVIAGPQPKDFALTP